jgi:hypothetical protein
VYDTQQKVNALQQQVQAEEDAKLASVYKGQVRIGYVTHSNDPAYEYLTLQVIGTPAQPIDITGWTLTSTSTGNTVQIPKAAKLYFANSPNSDTDVYLTAGDIAYVSTGYSPNGESFEVNKCSGYLGQFQTYVPSLNYNCPLPRSENTSSIPRSPNNDACLDYIQYFPQCRIQTDTLPLNWSYECTNFIYSKINYPSCVDTHKNDSDFYQHEWRIYLKRSDPLWKSQRESIILYDKAGKIVDILRY